MDQDRAEDWTRVALIVVPIVAIIALPSFFDPDTVLGMALGVVVVFGQILAFIWVPAWVGDLVSKKARRRLLRDQVIEKAQDPRDQDDDHR